MTTDNLQSFGESATINSNQVGPALGLVALALALVWVIFHTRREPPPSK